VTAWIALSSRFCAEDLGFLWDILMSEDKRPVREQLNERYAHGGGYRPFKGFTLDRMTMTMRYPGDPLFKPSAMTTIGDEQVFFYPQGQWLLILQPNGDFDVTRVD
jgi:hypothetical protein